MPWQAVYRTADGALMSVGDVVVSPLPAGLAVAALAGQPDFGSQRWNPTTRAMEAAPAVVIKDKLADFMAQTEISGLTAAQQTRVRAALDRIFTNVEGRFYA